jgi:phosphohistidine phosphatase SixA
MMSTASNHIPAATAIVGMLLAASQAPAQTLSGAALVNALKQGGYVIVMRHASSPAMPPDKEHANPDNTKLERQLDEAGRAGATAMGKALIDLKIPIGDVLTSPTYRALETVRFAKLANPHAFDELGDGGQSMQAIADAAAVWLRDRASQLPAPGTNTIIVTHMPNIARAFPDWQPQVADGESVVLRPAVSGQAQVVGRIRIEDWSALALRR